ncbi:MAG: GNAT family N-acetyltransferase [Betaproteobacteria bacterium]
MSWVITADPSRIDRCAVHDFLSRHAYWSRGIPRATVERALDYSLCFGAVAADVTDATPAARTARTAHTAHTEQTAHTAHTEQTAQAAQAAQAARTGPAADKAAAADGTDAPLIGFARVVTDQATFAYLCDVYVLPAWRGRGVARALLAAILADPRLRDLRRLLLFTRDAHGLYAGQGFTPLAHPERGMERLRADLYTATGITAQDLRA